MWQVGREARPRAPRHLWSDRNQRSGQEDKTPSRGQRPAPSPGAPAPALGSRPPWRFPFPCRCWVRDPWVHNILVMGYGGLTSVFNLVVLVWALRLLHQLRAREEVQSPRACRDSVTVLGLTMLLGTTWALAFFSFGVFLLPQLFLFTTFNSLYGKARGQRGGSPGGGAPHMLTAPGGKSGAEIEPLASSPSP